MRNLGESGIGGADGETADFETTDAGTADVEGGTVRDGWVTGDAEDLGTPSELEPVPDTGDARAAVTPAHLQADTEQMDER